MIIIFAINMNIESAYLRIVPSLSGKFKVKLYNPYIGGKHVYPSPFEQLLMNKLDITKGCIPPYIMFSNSEFPLRLCRHIVSTSRKQCNCQTLGYADIYLIIESDIVVNNWFVTTFIKDDKQYIAIHLREIQFIPNYEGILSDQSIMLDDFHKQHIKIFSKQYPLLTNMELIKKMLSYLDISNVGSITNLYDSFDKYIGIFTRHLPTANHFPYLCRKAVYSYNYKELSETIKFIQQAAISDKPDQAEYINKVVELFYTIIPEDDYNKQSLHIPSHYCIDIKPNNPEPIEILVYLIQSRYIHFDRYNYSSIQPHPLFLHYCYNGKHNWYVPNRWIYTLDVIEKYPNILSDVHILSTYFNNIIPFAIRLQIQEYIKDKWYGVDYLKNIGGLIGMWVCTCEPGTGSNAWLLHKPFDIKSFSLLIDVLYHIDHLNYCTIITDILNYEIVKVNNINKAFSNRYYEELIEDSNIINDLNDLFNTEFDMYYVIKWAKDIINKYPFLTELSSNYDLDESIFIPSPSGFTFIPWRICEW